jgi:hypothetical protein
MVVFMTGPSILQLNAELLRPPQPPQHNYAFNKFRPATSPEPTFIQRITSWFFPWGGVSSEEEFRVPASPKIDMPPLTIPPRPLQFQHSSNARIGPPPQVRDTEPTTARTTHSPPVTKCSPCNKVPWIPMMPTYQLPLVNSGSQQHQVYFKHHFGNENQYAQVPGSHKYVPPSTTQPPLTTPLKFQDGSVNNQGHRHYGVPPIKSVQFQGYQYSTQSPGYPKATSYKPNTNTIDTSVITFTTGRPQNNRPSRFTSPVTNSEYLPPPNILPLEGEHSQLAPIPIPNLSPTPIPPLFDYKNFHHDPYRSQKTGFIKLVPLEPVAQVSNNVNVQIKPDRSLQEFAAIKEIPTVEVISSNLVAEFTIPGTVYDDVTLRPRIEFSSKSPTQHNFRFNLDVGNNLDANTTINSPIIVESLERVTDNVGAGSEHEYEHNIHQALESPVNNLEDSDDDTINAEESNRVVPFHDYEQNSNLDEITTTEGNYIIKFEPSIQTAADLAENLPKNKSDGPSKVRDRLTPLELLDSPIFHVTPFTTKSSKVNLPTETQPPFKPIEDFTKKLATLWTSPIPISISTKPTLMQSDATTETTPDFKSTTNLILSSSTSSFLSKLSTGITLPREPLPVRLSGSTKKPKQIQIVIPYTTYHKPSPFKVQEEAEILTYRPLIRGHYVTHPTKKIEQNLIKNLKVEEPFNGLGYHNDQEYPDHAQESKIVESKVTIEPPRTTKYLTKILANNIRDLLKKEKTPKPPKIDLIRLQKNIDGWTEQSFLGKVSTISLTGHTKAIPSSFLSTTMKATTMMKFPSTTLSPKTTFEPELMEETKRQYDNILYKKEDDLLYVKRHDRFLDRDNELVLINNNLTFNTHHDGVKVFAPKTTLTPKELWKRLHLTFSPITNEKIYVVTPQPSREEEEVRTFRPRFSVRPTVASK